MQQHYSNQRIRQEGDSSINNTAFWIALGYSSGALQEHKNGISTVPGYFT